nr:uncharacterized protein LOC129267457 [Lytechinus pictus]
MTELSQKIELLENERKEDRASFEEKKREIESNWQKTVNDQVEMLYTQGLTVTKLSQKIEELENERKDWASCEEEKREIESNWPKILHDQVEKVKTQGETLSSNQNMISKTPQSCNVNSYPMMIIPRLLLATEE